jgi:hypothetical protein
MMAPAAVSNRAYRGLKSRSLFFPPQSAPAAAHFLAGEQSAVTRNKSQEFLIRSFASQ